MAGSLTTLSPSIEYDSARRQHILGLDTVRAFAALSVMLAHILGPKLPAFLTSLGLSRDMADVSKYVITGHPAVIVFFVVSGFCIHYPYTRRSLPVVAFTLARWMRIMPPALTAMLLAHMLHVNIISLTASYCGASCASFGITRCTHSSYCCRAKYHSPASFWFHS